MAALSFMGLFTMLFFGGFAASLPLGLPPGPEDPVMAHVAPDECLVYVSWAGTAEPDAQSANRTERLMADPEIQRFVSELKKRLKAALDQGAGEGERSKAVAAQLPTIIEAIATNPAALYVSQVSAGAEGINVPSGLIVNVGDDAAGVERSLIAIEKILVGDQVKLVKSGVFTWHEMPTPPGAPKVRWGMAGKYLVAGVGEGEIEAMLERGRSGKVPDWLAAVQQRLPVERRANVAYLNIAGGVKSAAPFLGPAQTQLTHVLDTLGLNNVKSLASVTGLDQSGCVSRTWLEMDGKPTGILAPLGAEPLTAGDLASIPADAHIALAARINAGELFDQFVDLVGAIEPRGREEILREMGQADEALGFSIRKDLLGSLGDTVCIYHSPSEGGTLYTAWTAIAPARDPEKLTEVSHQLAALIDKENGQRNERFGRLRRFVEIKDYEYQGQTVFFLNTVGDDVPFAPAWCITKEKVIFSLFPHGVHAVLNRPADAPTLASVPEVAGPIGQSSPPIVLAYYDSMQVCRAVYPLAQMFGNLFCAELQRQGVPIDISIMPSLPAIAKYLRPGSALVVPADDGVEVINRRTLPIGTDLVNLVFPFMFLAGTSRSMEIQAVREADAIRSSEAQEESTNESIREAPESPVDDNQNKKDSAVSPSKKAEEKIETDIGPEDSPRLERKQVLQPM